MESIVLILSGLVLSTAGKVLLGIAVIRVHRHLAKEQRIDYDVVQAVNFEKRVGLIGIILIVLGFMLEVAFYLAIPWGGV
jgi:hypothetical protein